ncbi:MAG: SprT-like domain-containing protein, partial [Nitrososphaera sp.]
MSETQDLKCAIGTYGLDVSKELDDKMEAEVNRLLRLAKYIYGKDVVVVWGYSFSMYRPKIGGSTFTVEGISFTFFNPVYLNKYRDDFINVVVRHEISHAVVDVIYPNAKEAHGAEWISVMKALGDKNPQKY